MTAGQKNTYHYKTKRYIHHLVQNLKINKSFIKNNNILVVELSSDFLYYKNKLFTKIILNNTKQYFVVNDE